MRSFAAGMSAILALVVLAADRLSAWLQKNRGVMRGLDYAFASVFSVFAVKIFLTHSR